VTLAAYRDAGLWSQLLHVCSSLLMRRHRGSFPPKGFVGQVSGSSVVTDLRLSSVKSIQLFPRASMYGAHLWRLTYVWEISPRQSLHTISGLSLVNSGKLEVGAGAAKSTG